MGCTGCTVESKTIENRKLNSIEPLFTINSFFWIPENSAQLAEYCLRTNSWESHTISKKSEQPAFDKFFTTVIMKQGVYVLGGMTNERTFLKRNICINTETFGLVEKRDMLIAKCNIGVGIIHVNKFMAVGGNNERVVTDTCLYDADTNEWSSKPHLNLPRYSPGVCLFSAKYLYVFGGCTIETTDAGEEKERTLCSIEQLNLTRTDTVWKLVPIYSSNWKGGMDCGCFQSSVNEILICGGLRDDGTLELSSEVHVFNLGTQTITRSNSLKEGDMFLGGLYYINKDTLGGVGLSGLFHSCSLRKVEWTISKAPNSSPIESGTQFEPLQKQSFSFNLLI